MEATCRGRKSFALPGTLLFPFSKRSGLLHGYNPAIKQLELSALTPADSGLGRGLHPACVRATVRVCMCGLRDPAVPCTGTMSHHFRSWLLSPGSLRGANPLSRGAPCLSCISRSLTPSCSFARFTVTGCSLRAWSVLLSKPEPSLPSRGSQPGTELAGASTGARARLINSKGHSGGTESGSGKAD